VSNKKRRCARVVLERYFRAESHGQKIVCQKKVWRYTSCYSSVFELSKDPRITRYVLENDFFGAVFLQQTAHTVTAGNCMCAHVMLCKFDKYALTLEDLRL